MAGVTVVGSLYGLVFVVAGLSKIEAWDAWRGTVRSMPVGRSVAGATTGVSAAVVASEFAVGVLSMVRPAPGLFAAGVLFAVLATGAGVLVPTHRGEECTCFGSLMKTEISPLLVVRNAALAVAAFLLWELAARHGAAGISLVDSIALILVGYLAIFIRDTWQSVVWRWQRNAVPSGTVENSVGGGRE
jgi:hypothetical protein